MRNWRRQRRHRDATDGSRATRGGRGISIAVGCAGGHHGSASMSWVHTSRAHKTRSSSASNIVNKQTYQSSTCNPMHNGIPTYAPRQYWFMLPACDLHSCRRSRWLNIISGATRLWRARTQPSWRHCSCRTREWLISIDPRAHTADTASTTSRSIPLRIV